MIAAGQLGAGIARACASASARADHGASRHAMVKAFERLTNLRPDQHDLVLHRGRCRNPKRGGCPSRYGVIRITVDLRDPKRQDQYAAMECALCARTWHRTRVPVMGRERYQRHKLTLILPPRKAQKRFVTVRGRTVIEGEDCQTVREARYSELIDAVAAWRTRNDRVGMARWRADKKKREQGEADMATYRAQRDRIAALEAAMKAARDEA